MSKLSLSVIDWSSLGGACGSWNPSPEIGLQITLRESLDSWVWVGFRPQAGSHVILQYAVPGGSMRDLKNKAKNDP
jgi:hypothetical protein